MTMSNKEHVELIGYYGSDTIHSLSAWTSTNRDLTEDKKKRMPDMLKMLAENGHHTPFEKSMIHFLCTTSISSHIHILKHRVGVSVNAESARYKELKEDKFFLPQDFIGIKANTHALTIDDKESDWYDLLERYTQIGNQLYHDCLRDIEPTLGRKRAKESARYFKGYNSQMTADVAFNFRSFVHFLKLRNKPEAQLEVREVAAQMLELVKNIDGNPFEHTIKAFHL
jgi:thymidylate synthase (FAD)